MFTAAYARISLLSAVNTDPLNLSKFKMVKFYFYLSDFDKKVLEFSKLKILKNP